MDLAAQRVKNALPDCLAFGRLGSSRFLAVIEGTDEHSALTALIEALVQQVVGPARLLQGNMSSACAVGVSVYPQDAITHEQLLRNADLAMNHARERGGNAYAFFTPELQAQLTDHMAVRNALQGALERDEFSLHYQPQVCAATGRMFAVEALLRWNSASLGAVEPVRFLPIAEASGWMEAISAWVLERACRQGRDWLDAGRPLRVAVNACARDVEARGFVPAVGAALAMSSLPAELLEIELTESMLMQQSRQSLDNLQALRKMGVRVAIDDFGTGYSSLAYLKHFSFDTLKIDRLFTSELSASAPDSVLVRAIVAVAREMQITVLAEGVETEAQRVALQAMGCCRMQGYLFGRPMPAEKLQVVLSGVNQSGL